MTFSQDPFAPSAAAPAMTLKVADASSASVRENGVPRGSVREILAWVGDDRGKAQLALETEQGEDRPRKSLVNELNDRLDEPAPAAEPQPEADTSEEQVP